MAQKRGTITRVACLPCQILKTKCDGIRPVCSRCQSKGKRCEYRMEEEERSPKFVRAESKRRAEELNSLWSIVHALQNTDEHAATLLLHRLRNTHDILKFGAEIEIPKKSDDAMADHPRPDETQTSESSVSRTGNRPVLTDQPAQESVEEEFRGLQFGSAGKLAASYTQFVSPPISYAPEGSSVSWSGADWANITNDQDRVNQLITQYLTWQHGLFEIFDERNFRRDLQAQCGEYYSPLLIHSICATSSMLVDSINAQDEFARHRERATSLLNSHPRASLSTIASMSLLCHLEHSEGRLSAMWLLCGRMMRMTQDLQLHLHEAKPTSDENKNTAAELRCFWSAFFIDSIVSLSLARLPSIPTTAITVALPPIETERDVREWNSADFFMKKKPALQSSTFHSLAALASLVNSTLNLFYAPPYHITARIVNAEHKKYLEWFDSLPLGLRSCADAPPHVLHLHMQYYAAVLLLYRPFLSTRFPNFPHIRPRQIAMIAAQNISSTFREHLHQYQHRGVCTLQVHALLVACTVHILNLDTQRSVDDLVAACHSFRTLKSRMLWASASLQIIQGLVIRWSISLPAQVFKALHGQDQLESTFDFGGTNQADSYLLHHATGEHGDTNDKGPGIASPFRVFPNQSLPILRPSLDQVPVFPAFSDSLNMGGIDDIEWLGEGWIADLASEHGPREHHGQ